MANKKGYTYCLYACHLYLLWILNLTTKVSPHPTRTHEQSRLYGVIIDAGSSGSRVRVYEWLQSDRRDILPVYNETLKVKNKPGIAHFREGNLDELTPYLKVLIDAAKDKVPEASHSDTHIYLMATAGMRLLLEPRANAIMERIQQILADPKICPFRFHELQARILSGEEEGVFAWIAANYLNGFFDNPDERESAGILELGGASTQIAFVPDGSILADKFPVRLGGRVYPLYVHSYLYYGQNYAELWVKEYLYRESNYDQHHLPNPCMLKGDNSSTNISNTIVTFDGTGDPLRCIDIVKQLVYKVPGYLCQPKPCAVGPVYQPSVPEDKTFFALSAFAYPLQTLDVLDENGFFTPEATFISALDYCQKDINTIIEETNRSPEFLSVECLMGLYIPVLFTRGYGFGNDTRQVAAKFNINGQPAEWTLGAVIYEAERAFLESCSDPDPVSKAMGVTGQGAKPSCTVFPIIVFLAVSSITRHLRSLL